MINIYTKIKFLEWWFSNIDCKSNDNNLLTTISFHSYSSHVSTSQLQCVDTSCENYWRYISSAFRPIYGSTGPTASPRLCGKCIVIKTDAVYGLLTRYVKFRVAHALGLPGTFYPPPTCMSGLLNRGGGENVPGIPRACATRNFTYLARGPCSGLNGEVSVHICLVSWCHVIPRGIN